MDNLFAPIKIGNKILKNRFMMAPMENGLAEMGTGEVTDKLINWYVERAKNDIAILLTGSIGVSPEGRGLPTQMSMFDEKHVNGHKRLVDAVHNAGAMMGAQLYHAGRQTSKAVTGLDPLAPSPIPCAILNNDPKEITKQQMEDLKQKFVYAARKCVEVGYDLIEVHFAHGYLLHSFMSPHTNHRNDEYNGSFENRIKYPMEVLNAIMETVNGEIPVTIRVSVDEFVEDGLHFDEVKEICKICEKAGVKAISLSAGCYDAVDYTIQPMYIPQGFIVPYSEEIKKIVNIPVIVAARLNSAELIENIIENNKADMVAIGRGLIADPELAVKIKNKQYDRIRYCIACNQGCIDNVLIGKNANCLVNPCAGREQEAKLNPISVKKKVIVIGAGPAGLQCAMTLKERGHEVIVLDKNNMLGGKLKTVATPPEKETFLLFKNFLKEEVERYGIRIIQKEVKCVECIDEYSPDAVVIATGASQNKPPIKGIDNHNVVFAEDVLNGQNVKDTVCIIGGGLVGTETAKYLACKGKKVEIVEMLDSIANGIGATFIGHLFKTIEKYKIKVHLNAKVKEISETEVILEDNKTIPAESVVIATGYKSNNELEEELKKTCDEIYVIGDAKEPRRILNAVYEGFDVANRI